MSIKEIMDLLKTSGLQVAYRSFPEEEAPPLPYICFLVAGYDNFAADGIVYYEAKQITVELYTKHKDILMEEKVEKALSSFYWEKSEEYIDDEKCYQITYELEV